MGIEMTVEGEGLEINETIIAHLCAPEPTWFLTKSQSGIEPVTEQC